MDPPTETSAMDAPMETIALTVSETTSTTDEPVQEPTEETTLESTQEPSEPSTQEPSEEPTQELTQHPIQDAQVETHPANVEIDSVLEAAVLTVEDAQAHIAGLRRDRLGEDGRGDGTNSKTLERVLRVTSDDLYTQSSRFLFELIQNGDDNTYDANVLPTISFHSEPGTLQIRCNEMGFEKDNVDAICDANNSSKKDKTRPSIGEKGIGFKSVFSVASQVWINSNLYSFRFDRDAPLGMVAPIWSTFPKKAEKGMTQFLLSLDMERGGLKEKEIRGQLREFNATVLLFLRKLRRITLSLDYGPNDIASRFERDICRTDYQEYAGEIVAIHGDRTLQRKLSGDMEYLIVRHTLDDMPQEDRRAGLGTSEVVLGFPVKDGEPSFRQQQAYAFLPICETSFRFLLQADFVLVSSRENISANKPWNEALLAGLSDCFAAAVDRFNHSDSRKFRHCWPGFLRNAPDSGPFSGLTKRIFKRLEKHPALETCSGKIVQPAGSLFAPPSFCDEHGSCLLAHGGDRFHYISSKYSPFDTDQAVLQHLGVEMLAFERFQEILTWQMFHAKTTYMARPAAWHTTVAKILMQHAKLADARIWPLIPLQNGEWVAAVDGPCLFEEASAKLSNRFPEGIAELRIVPAAVKADAIRRNFLTRLGVKDLNRSEVCRFIKLFHERPTAPLVDVDNLIFHATYLFRAVKSKCQVTIPKTFWVQSAVGEPRLAKDVYTDSMGINTPKLTEILAGPEWASRLLHPAYTLGMNGQKLEGWLNWLETFLGVRTYMQIGRAGTFTPEFEYVLHNLPTETALDVVVAAWVKDKSSFTSKIIERISRMMVMCVDGQQVPLEQTCLAVTSLQAHEIPGLRFFTVKDPDSTKWLVLENFKVVVKPDLSLYLRCLELTQGRSDVKIEEMTALYKGIETFAISNTKAVRDHFNIYRAIWIPNKNVWALRNECVWERTRGLPDENVLFDHYRGLKSLFLDHLMIRSAKVEAIINRLKGTTVADTEFSSLHDLLFALSTHFQRHPETFGKLLLLKDIPIMPILGPTEQRGAILRPLNRSGWLFRDRNDYYDCFANTEIRFADFSVEQYVDLKSLNTAISKAWAGEERCLSELVTLEKRVGSKSCLDKKVTAWLRTKLIFIRRIVRAARVLDTAHKLKLLHHLKIVCAPEMHMRTSISRGGPGRVVNGKPIYPKVFPRVTQEDVTFFVLPGVGQYPHCKALADQICIVCDITDGKLSRLIHDVLTVDEASEIFDLLAEGKVGFHDVPPYYPLPLPQPDIDQSETCGPPLGETSANIPAKTAHSPKDRKPSEQPGTTLPSTDKKEVERPVNGRPMATSHIDRAMYQPVESKQEVKTENATFRAPTSAVGRTDYNGSMRQTMASQLLVDNPCTVTVRNTVQERESSNLPVRNGCASYGRRPLVSAQPPRVQHDVSRLSPTAHVGLGSQSTLAPGHVGNIKFQSDPDSRRERWIGIMGEVKVWKLLEEILSDDWKEAYWTSELRGAKDLHDFAGKTFSKWQSESDATTYADFTVPDSGYKLTRWLTENKIHISPLHDFAGTHPHRVYHIEVKATNGPAAEPFHISKWQMKKCQELAGDRYNVFMIFRLFEIENGVGGMEIYLDPATMIEKKELGCEAESWLVGSGVGVGEE